MEIEGLKEQINHYKDKIVENNNQREEIQSKTLSERVQFDQIKDTLTQSIEEKNRSIKKLESELESVERRLNLLEDKTVPTEEDTIREMILKTRKMEGEL